MRQRNVGSPRVVIRTLGQFIITSSCRSPRLASSPRPSPFPSRRLAPWPSPPLTSSSRGLRIVLIPAVTLFFSSLLFFPPRRRRRRALARPLVLRIPRLRWRPTARSFAGEFYMSARRKRRAKVGRASIIQSGRIWHLELFSQTVLDIKSESWPGRRSGGGSHSAGSKGETALIPLGPKSQSHLAPRPLERAGWSAVGRYSLIAGLSFTYTKCHPC